MKKIILALVVFVFATAIAQAQSGGFNTGMPFGVIGPKEMDGLEHLAKEKGVDLFGDLKRAYAKDEQALARVFAFSLNFANLDRDAKTYGQLIYSSFLNLASVYGVERYSQLVAAQPTRVAQRIRDFIYYDATQAPKSDRAKAEMSARRAAPQLFPKDYRFAADNPLFASAG